MRVRRDDRLTWVKDACRKHDKTLADMGASHVAGTRMPCERAGGGAAIGRSHRKADLPLALLPSQEKLRDGHRDSRESWPGTAPVDSATASSFACEGGGTA